MSHLDVLGLPFDARLDDIKAAYRSLAKTCHPDLFRAMLTRMSGFVRSSMPMTV